MAAEDNRNIAVPQTGMNRDLHPSSLTDQHYTFALNANIESEDGNVGMRSNEHSNLKCIDFYGFKVIGYKNDLTSGNIYFFITNPETGVSKITYFKPESDTSILSDSDIESMVEGSESLCSGMKTLLEDNEQDPCLKFSIYHPIKTIEIKTEKCGKCIYWTDDYNPPRYVIVDKALTPDDEGDIWYHYHGYKICDKEYDRKKFMQENGCFLACEKLRVFPLLKPMCIEPAQIEYGGSLRSGVYQATVAPCDEFGNELGSYSNPTNPVPIFDEQYITQKDGKWGERTNLGIRFVVSNIDRQVEYFKVVIIQNTVGYNGETQPVVDYFVEGIHPVSEKTILYYSDLNNKRTTFEHISLKKPVYNTSRGIVAVGNRLLQYGLTAEKEWNLQPVVSLMGHFLQWQASVAHEDLYKDGNACSLYVGYMRNEVYPFAISFKCSNGYKTPAFVLIPPPYKDAAAEIENKDTDRVYKSINQYAPPCSGQERKFKWQYYNTAGDPKDFDDEETGQEECKNPATIGQTITLQNDFKTYTNVSFTFRSQIIIDEVINYFSSNIKDIACNTATEEPNNAAANEICDIFNSYGDPDDPNTEEQKEAIDGIEAPEFGAECTDAHRQYSLITAPVDRIVGFREEYTYKELEDMEHVSTDYLYTTGGEKQDKYSVLFNWELQEQMIEFMDKYFFADDEDGGHWAGFWSGDDGTKACAVYDSLLQPSVILQSIAEAIYVLDSMPCTCGCFIEEPCLNPTVARSDYNSFQSSSTLLGAYLLMNDVWNNDKEDEEGKVCFNGRCLPDWRAGRSSSTIHNDAYRSRIAPGALIRDTWPEIEKKIDDYSYNFLDTGYVPEGDYGDGWTWDSYANLADNNVGALIPEDVKGSTMFTSELLVWRFTKCVLRNARFLHITRPKEWDDPDFPAKDKVLYLESLGKIDGLMDAVSTQYVRLSFWKSLDPRYKGSNRKIDKDDLNFNWEKIMDEGDNYVIVGASRPYFGHIGESFFDKYPDGLYVAIDCPIVSCPWIFTVRQIDFCKVKDDGEEENSKNPSRGLVGTSYVLGKTIYPYIFGIREKEIDRINVRAKEISLRATVEYASQCTICGDRPINCAPRKYKYGDFAYWESSEKYPANFELYDSSKVKISDHGYEGNSKKAYDNIVSKLTEYYGSPSTDDKGMMSFKGHKYGTVDTSTVFCQQPIRHYKFPDNDHMLFMNRDVRSYDVPSDIYPIGILVDEDMINVFLDFAVDSGLITKEQRDMVTGYEIYRGDRRLNRSVIATGIAYDMYRYSGQNSNLNLYPNYPYNDLSDDSFNYATEKRVSFITHPFFRRGNVWYAFSSPDIYFNKPETPTEVAIEGFIRGMSVGNFDEVEDHPKWTILGKQSYKMAATLANIESTATIASQIAEELMNRSTSAYIGVIGNINMAMIFASMIATISDTLAKRPVLYGKYRYDWLTTFINNGPRRNHAFYYTSVGYYNSMMGFDDTAPYEQNRLRGLANTKSLKSGMYPISDPSTTSSWVTGEDMGDDNQNASKDFLFVNNIDRESSMFLSFGDPGEKDPDTSILNSKYLVSYPMQAQVYDTSRIHDPVIMASDAGSKESFERTKMLSYICSPYMKLMRYRPDQYGAIEDIKWISVGGCGFFQGGKQQLFGGDTYISRFSMKRKFPFFYNTAFGIGDMIPFAYNDYRNVGFPKYFVNYDTGEDMLEHTDNERFNSWTSSSKGTYSFYPNRKSLYNLNGENEAKKYVDGRFYLWSYGIPQFLVESEINCNFRLEGVEPHEWFYPAHGNFAWWTQEKNVSIHRDNDYKISPIYSSRMTLTPNVLPATYERRFYDCAYQRPNGVIWSRADVSENSQTDPWLTYKPMDYHEFPTSNGKLIHMKRIESNQILVRFEDQVSLHNAIDVIKERTSPGQAEMGTGGLFASRPLEYNTTDLGYSGTQSTEIISSEFGHFWVDTKRAQVFMTDPNGRNLKELSVGIRHWLKRHLPFKILRYGITNILTGTEMTEEDTDNKFIGLGLSLGWDNRYKRVLITKKDYIPVKNPAYYKYDGGRFLYNETEVLSNDKEISLKDEQYFKDVSFTIGYSCLKQEWISYYSFCPDYYIEQQQYFQTGINFPTSDEEGGLWSHLLTNKSFQTFYGATYPFILEVPIKEKYNGSTLASVEYELDARKYVDDVNYTLDRKVGLDTITIYNDTNNSGEIHLVPEEKNNLAQRISYPKIVGDYTEVLDTEVYRRHKLNDFFNRVDDDRSDTPIWIKDDNDINKSVNPDALNFRRSWLDRLRGSWMLMRIKKVISSRKIIFQWLISEDKIKNR